MVLQPVYTLKPMNGSNLFFTLMDTPKKAGAQYHCISHFSYNPSLAVRLTVRQTVPLTDGAAILEAVKVIIESPVFFVK